MKANTLYYLALNLAALDSSVHGFDIAGLFRNPSHHIGRAPAEVSFPPPLSVFNYLSCRISAQIDNNLLPIWEQPTPADCPYPSGDSS
ncbi:hypothetical protein H4R23_006790, partial [Coemansia sp. Cherry 401B]